MLLLLLLWLRQRALVARAAAAALLLPEAASRPPTYIEAAFAAAFEVAVVHLVRVVLRSFDGRRRRRWPLQ